MKQYQLVVPMSGKGTRFRHAGYKDLKPFIQVAGKPIIAHILDMYPNRTKTIFVVNSTDPEIDEHNKILKQISPESIICEIPDNRLGPSYAVLAAKSELTPTMPVVVNYADFAGVWSEEDFLNELIENDASILTYTGFHPHMLRNTSYAYVKKKNGFVTHIQEKKSYTEYPMGEEASAGAYAFKTASLLLSAIDTQIERNLSLNSEFYTSLTMQPIIDQEKKISTCLMEKFYQWGTPEDLEDWKAWRQFIEKLPKSGITLNSNLPHDVAILAGGKGARLNNETPIPKALFPVKGKQLWSYSIINGETVKNHLLIRKEYLKEVKESLDVTCTPIELETRGQAETAQIALDSCKNNPGGISFLACDNILLGLTITFSNKVPDEDALYVWVASSYQNAKIQPEQFSWVQIAESGEIINFFPKQNPNGDNCKTVIGNFTFSSKEFAQEALTYCNSPENFVNGEPYLDSAISFALKNSKKVIEIEVENFTAIGTAAELKTFEYWNDCENRKLLGWK